MSNAIKRGSRSSYLRALAIAALSLVLLAPGSLAQAQYQKTSREEDSLRRFLQGYIGRPHSNEETPFYYAAFVDLKDDGEHEAIVYLTGRNWCGSGGCSTLILAPTDSSYKIITSITIAKLPIRVLKSKSHGWHDIAVVVQGGGIMTPYEARLSFNGTRYPGNPTVQPARPLTAKAEGKVVIPVTEQGRPLF